MTETNQNSNTNPAEPEYLPSGTFSKKYNINRHTIDNWIKKGWVTAKKINDSLGRPRWYVLDVPPQLHPSFSNKKPVPAHTLGSGKTTINRTSLEPSEKTTEARKKRLREFYLPLFEEKAPPGQMTFLASELIEMFGVSTLTLYTIWPAWGLRKHLVPISTDPRGGHVYGDTVGVNKSTGRREATYYYTRTEIYNFLSGRWETKGFETTDDKVISGVLGGITTETGWYEYKPSEVYPFDGEGAIEWIQNKQIMREDKRLNRWVPIKLWDKQKEFIREAFRRVNNEYQYRIIIACWPRGESKTTLIALLALFRFFNLFGEVINLSGNSKDQATFAHYDLLKKTILNTPSLSKTHGLMVKEKYIGLFAGPNNPVCQIKAIPTSTGLLPGTTCAVFTELHKLEDRQFFIDLWTSTRATPNAMVLVDTTVAPKGHVVYSMWEVFQKGEDPHLFFHHYQDQICNPETTPSQLASFKRHMLEVEYNKYFRNRWEDAAGALFSAKEIRKINYGGLAA